MRVVELELSAPAPDHDGPPGGHRPPALALVRMHGRPIGTLRLPDLNPSDDPGMIARLVRQHLEPVVRDHLDADGLPTELAPSLPMVPPATCHAGTGATPPVSVVVCTRNRPVELSVCLRSLLDLDYPAYRVLVVDNSAGDPASREVVESAAAHREGVQYLVEPRIGLSRARNTGLRVARTELVAFTDDDVLVDQGWLRGLVAGFADPVVQCVTGLTMPAELETRAQVWFEEFGGFGRGFTTRRYEPPQRSGRGQLYPYTPGRFGAGVNMAFRRWAVLDAGGFDECLGAGTPAKGGEDLDMFLSLLLAGGAVEYRPDALVWHRHRRDVKALERQVRDYGIGLTAMVTKRLLTDPGQRRDIGRRVPRAIVHALSGKSEKNRYKGSSYPRSLSRSELLGMVWGPIAYGVSRCRRDR
jgi:GT2 family glycosyltransferase